MKRGWVRVNIKQHKSYKLLWLYMGWYDMKMPDMRSFVANI